MTDVPALTRVQISERNTAEADEMVLVANNPAEMEQSQKRLILWAAKKMQAEKELLADAQENHAMAVKSKWRAEPWKRRIKLSEQRIEYYRKIKMALEAGYYIVPPFPVDVFAIRTGKSAPKWKAVSEPYFENGKGWRPHYLVQSAQNLPAGEGTYVSPDPSYTTRDTSYTNTEGKKIQRWTYTADQWRDPEFPMALARGQIMQQTREAMAARVFDQLGIVPQTTRRGDPIIIGQILRPGPKNQTPVSFFVTWWLDTKDL